jgi:protein TonB
LGKLAEGIPNKGSTTGTVGDASGKVLGKPLYLVRPQVNYPSESRVAGEQGVVLLRITVNAGGRPTAVNVATSSGFSRLDRAAVEGGWRCRVSNAFEGAQFEAPLRFSLQDR